MFDSEQLQKYLAENDTEAAKKLLADYFTAAPTEQEKAEAYTLLAEIYLQSSNRINEQYLDDTADSVKALQDLEELEAKTQDSVDLVNTRKALE